MTTKAREIEALVVGAGPVGMLAALALAERGVAVEIVDEEWRATSRSYALALHAGTLERLDRMESGDGLVDQLLARGHRVDRIAFYDGAQGREPRATVDLGALGGNHPFVLVLPQKDLEDLLEERLERHGVRVRWNHRLADLQVGEGDERSRAVVEHLGKESTGYSVATTVWVVEKTLELAPRYVVGADGHRSRVRRALGVEFPELGAPALYAVFELGSSAGPAEEVRVVLGSDSGDPPADTRGPGGAGRSDVLWPLGPDRRRWSFQVQPAALEREDRKRPDKSRLAVQVGRHSYPYLSRESMEALIAERAPWFEGPLGDLAWSVAVQFERRLAAELGRDGVWLAGDAAHLGPPIGVHSMNAGLAEALELAQGIASGAPDTLEPYGIAVRAAWRQLLDLTKGKGVEATPGADPWVAQHAGRILASLPAAGDHRKRLAEQLGLRV